MDKFDYTHNECLGSLWKPTAKWERTDIKGPPHILSRGARTLRFLLLLSGDDHELIYAVNFDFESLNVSNTDNKVYRIAILRAEHAAARPLLWTFGRS